MCNVPLRLLHFVGLDSLLIVSGAVKYAVPFIRNPGFLFEAKQKHSDSA